MKRNVIILLLSLCVPFFATAGDYKADWKKGTDFYLQKRYDSAAFYFEKVAASRPANAEIFYNLGNAYYRLNKIALAAVNYERALHIDPYYKEAQENLTITQARISHHVAVVEDIFFIAWWKDITANGKSSSWAIAALITFTLVIVLSGLRRYTAAGQRMPVQLPGILGGVCGTFLLFGTVAAFREAAPAGAVVSENDAPLMNADLKGKPLMLCPEGTSVQVKTDRGNWLEVSLPDGRTGWINRSQLIRI
ncbi:MAG: tetratricopeptide repeat protein [Flavipsychrobacter sp.]|nr:tetratricopeptide repeat protein [Flavipsychrobacter sp.]